MLAHDNRVIVQRIADDSRGADADLQVLPAGVHYENLFLCPIAGDIDQLQLTILGQKVGENGARPKQETVRPRIAL